MRDRFTKKTELFRRQFLCLGLGAGVLNSLRSAAQGAGYKQKPLATDVIEIHITNNYRIGRWFFDPVGIYLGPGQKVRWVSRKWGGSATAFHPSNGNHELRIPKSAQPFDSGVLTEGHPQSSTFEWVFESEGTYDFFSLHHERLGAVGRIVVGSAGGPAALPPGYGGREGRAPMFPDAAKLLSWLKPERIVAEKQLRYPRELLQRNFPLVAS